MIKCTKCNEVSGIARAGQVRGKQRYHCKHCNYYFTFQSPPPGKKSSPAHHATILDIAHKLKISKSTVSRALRNSADINQETRDAVLKMAQELNYVPNYFASSLVRRKSYSIGIVVPELITNFFSQFIIIAQKAASLAGYEVVICHSNESFSNEVDVLKRLFAYQVDGVLLSLSSETKSLDHLQVYSDAGVPVVLFNRVKNKPGFPTVLADDYHGAFIGTEHLVKNGYRNIGHIGGPGNLQISKNRFRGYRDALTKHGLEYNPNWTIYHDLSQADACKCAKTLLDKSSRPDAVFAVNDPAAIYLIIEAKKRGLHVGPDLGIVGFSNDSRSEVIEPSLTTLQQPIEQMAETCIHLLLNKIKDDRFAIPPTTVLKTTLIERCSSKKEGARGKEFKSLIV
ncbi:substrate-binding domain-containing protein [Terrimonas sp. NA20]|uniref:Substrate-binding domain-containing protein n=1 Tax=Terrimonas ginsenosidimutans TaxID=2908004 RepID=A0ABS9KM35_9BACT|nr:substrate-binding domain-containing protein [Terrimonas ginsenosidimutans]